MATICCASQAIALLLIVVSTLQIMSRHIKNFLRGFGSVIDIAPAPTCRDRFVPRDTDAERLRKDFERVGSDMHKAFDSQYEQASATPRR